MKQTLSALIALVAVATLPTHQAAAITKPPQEGYYHVILGHQYLTAPASTTHSRARGSADMAVRLVSEPQGPLSEWRIMRDPDEDGDEGVVFMQALTGEFLMYSGEAMPYAYVRVGREAAVWHIHSATKDLYDDGEEGDRRTNTKDRLVEIETVERYKKHSLLLGRHPSREFPRYVGLFPHSHSGGGGDDDHAPGPGFGWRLRKLEAREEDAINVLEDDQLVM
ncbi:hypothetical protein BGZ73_006253 [Actinomortierella ambigua]|nr:hypothetical protein BGZ73_006253 [Actinomortierella ambigua]